MRQALYRNGLEIYGADQSADVATLVDYMAKRDQLVALRWTKLQRDCSPRERCASMGSSWSPPAQRRRAGA